MPVLGLSRPQRAVLWLGHYANETALLWPAAVILVLTLRLLRHNLWMGWPGLLLALLLFVVAGVVLLAYLVELSVHDQTMCPRDLPGKVLLDPAGAVRRHGRQLQLFHWILDGGRRVTLVPATPTALLIFAVVGPVTWWPVLVGAAAGGTVGHVMCVRNIRIHKQLRPWCPHCQQRGAFSLHPAPAERQS